MRLYKTISTVLVVAIALLTACSKESKTPDVTGSIRQALDQAGLNDVRVSQDREKNVVTLTGSVPLRGR